LPANFGQLSMLKVLWLKYNQLTTLPESFGQLSMLKNLVLENNKLTTLPASFGQLSMLKVLLLEHNQLTTLPESFGQLSMLTNVGLDDECRKQNMDILNSIPLFGSKSLGLSHVRITVFQKLMLLFSLGLAVFDMGTDVLTASIFYKEGRKSFFVAQVLFFSIPAFILTIGVDKSTYLWNQMNMGRWEIFERVATFFQLRIFIETYRTWVSGIETKSFVELKTFEALIEGVPSAVLQLYIVFVEPGSNSLFILSSVVSLFAIAGTISHNFPPNKATDNKPEELSHILIALSNIAEVCMRIFTALAMFLGAGPFGFIPVMVSICFRVGWFTFKSKFSPVELVYYLWGGSHDDFDKFKMNDDFDKFKIQLLDPVRAITISITTAGAGFKHFYVIFITFLNMLDLAIGLSLLFTPQSNASRFSAMLVMTIAVTSFGLFCLLSCDRYKFKTINPPLRKLEDNFLKYIGEVLGVFCCCCCDHTTKDEKIKEVSMV